MNYESAAKLSFYKHLYDLKDDGSVCVVKNTQTDTLYIKKILPLSSLVIYSALKDHPVEGTPRVFEIFEEDGADFFIAIEEYITGMTLDNYIKQNGILDEKLAADFAIELCEILNRLHSMKPQIVHRDITLSNIMVSSSKSIVLIDFDASKFYDNKKVRDTMLIGTAGFAAPEQYGFGLSSPATDIWAVGVILNAMLLGKISSTEFAPGKFKRIIKKCLNIKAEDRYKNVIILKNEIKKARSLFVLPGFRTDSNIKKVAAIAIYISIFLFSVTGTPENVTSLSEIIILDFGIFSWLTCQFFLLANYANIQSILPLCKSEKLFTKITGLVVWSAVLMGLSAFLTAFLEILFI